MILDQLFHIAKAAEEATHATQDTGIAGMFGLSWKLFIAQLINFGIVVFVLWKWVFIPVTKALEKRTAKIEKSLRDAETVELEKVHFEEWRKEEMTKARKEASDIVSSASHEAETVKTSILSQAKEEQQKLVERTKGELEREKMKSVEDAKKELAELVVQATEKIIKEKLDDKKDKALIEQSLKNIK